MQSNPPRSASAICAYAYVKSRGKEEEGTEVGDREAAEITAIIAIEVRTDRCLLNPIGNRREVERDLLPRFCVPIPTGRGVRGEQEERCSPRKVGGLRRLTRELTGRIPRNGATTIYDLTFHARTASVQGDFTQSRFPRLIL